MRFDKKNPKFMTDFITLIFAMAAIVLAIIVIISGSDMLLPFVFYAGAAMFAANVVRGIISSKFLFGIMAIPALICLAGGLMTQGVIAPWKF